MNQESHSSNYVGTIRESDSLKTKQTLDIPVGAKINGRQRNRDSQRVSTPTGGQVLGVASNRAKVAIRDGGSAIPSIVNWTVDSLHNQKRLLIETQFAWQLQRVRQTRLIVTAIRKTAARRTNNSIAKISFSGRAIASFTLLIALRPDHLSKRLPSSFFRFLLGCSFSRAQQLLVRPDSIDFVTPARINLGCRIEHSLDFVGVIAFIKTHMPSLTLLR